jgi:hypothetical protein
MTMFQFAVVATILVIFGNCMVNAQGESHIRVRPAFTRMSYKGCIYFGHFWIIQVRRGNFGERYSGGIGPSSAQGVGYGGTTSLGHHSGGGGGGPPFDHITQKAISGGNDRFIQSYQVS